MGRTSFFKLVEKNPPSYRFVSGTALMTIPKMAMECGNWHSLMALKQDQCTHLLHMILLFMSARWVSKCKPAQGPLRHCTMPAPIMDDLRKNIPILPEAFFFRPLLSIQWTLYSMYFMLLSKGASKNTYIFLKSEQRPDMGGWVAYGKLAIQISKYE